MTATVNHREKRTLERKPFTQSIAFEVSNLESEKFKSLSLSGEAVDINSNGLGLRTTTPLNRGEVVKVYVPIPALDTVLPSFSEVRWVRAADSYFRVGLQFLA